MLYNMKSFLRISFTIILLLFLGTFCFANPLETANNLYKILVENSLAPQKQYLNGNLSENFAYNILIDFGNTRNEREILISISQEETDLILPDIISFLLTLKQEKISVPVKVIFSALDSTQLPEPLGIKNSGLKTFVSNTDFSNDCVSFVLNAANYSESKKNEYISLITGGANTVTPFTLLQNVINSCKQTNFDYYIEVSYFSLFRLGAVKVPSQLEYFLSNDIPSIAFNIESPKQIANTFAVLKQVILNLDKETTKSLVEWDRQYSILTFFNKTFVFTEKIQVYFFITIFLFLFMLLFSVTFAKSNSAIIKTDLKQTWYLPVALLLINTISFFIAEKICILIITDWQFYPGFTLFMKLLVSLSIFYIVSASHYFIDFPNQSEIYSHLTVFTSILNLLVYSLLDFAFMPLFLIQLILFFAFRKLKKTYELIIACIICIIPSLPFAITLISNCNTEALYKLINSPFMQNTIYAFLLLPYQFMILRIIVSRGAFGKHFTTTIEKILKAFIIPAAFLFLFIFVSIIFSIVTTKLNVFSTTKISLTESASTSIEIAPSQKMEHNYTEYSCRLISKEQPIRYDIQISSDDILPLFDSNYPCDILSESKKCVYHLEEFPPKDFYLNWKTDSKEKPLITIDAFFKSSKKTVRREKYKINFGELF